MAGDVACGDVRGLAALVTGASRGVGAGVAVRLAAQGVRGLCLLARDATALQAVAERCRAAAPSAAALRVTIAVCDVTATAKACAAVDDAARELGGLDIVVMNAGVNKAHMVAKVSADEMDAVIDTNFRAVAHMSRAALPHLVDSGGSLVIVASYFARTFALVPGHATYTATKNAVAGFAEGLWAEYRQLGVRIITLFPGLVNTGMGAGFGTEFGSIIDRDAKPEQLVQPDDIGAAVVATAGAPRTAVMTEVDLQPQLDHFRQGAFTQKAKLDALVASRPAGFRDANIALISGAGRGIGRGCAVELARSGYHVALVARTRSELEETAKQCRTANAACQTLVLPLDVCDRTALADAVEQTVQNFGTLSCCVQVAGINRRRNSAVSSMEVWDKVMAVNLLSSMHLTTLVLPHLLRHERFAERRGRASLIYVNTNYARSKQMVLPGIAPYVSSKTGQAGFARTVFEDVRNFGVKVSTIYPALVNTSLGMKPGPVEQLGKGVGKGGGNLLLPEDAIQPSDLGYACVYIAQQPSHCCPVSVAIDSWGHTLPLVRRHALKFIKKEAPEWEGRAKL